MESNQSSSVCKKDDPVPNTKSSLIVYWRMGCADSSSLLLLPLYGRIYVIPPPGDVNRPKTNLRTLIRISFDAPYLDEEYDFQSISSVAWQPGLKGFCLCVAEFNCCTRIRKKTCFPKMWKWQVGLEQSAEECHLPVCQVTKTLSLASVAIIIESRAFPHAIIITKALAKKSALHRLKLLGCLTTCS